MQNKTYLQFPNSLLACCTRARNLDKVRGVHLGQLIGIDGLADQVVRTRSRELDLRTGTVLELGKVLATPTNKSTVLRRWNADSKDNTITKSSCSFLQLNLELGDELWFTAEVNFV